MLALLDGCSATSLEQNSHHSPISRTQRLTGKVNSDIEKRCGPAGCEAPQPMERKVGGWETTFGNLFSGADDAQAEFVNTNQPLSLKRRVRREPHLHCASWPHTARPIVSNEDPH